MILSNHVYDIYIYTYIYILDIPYWPQAAKLATEATYNSPKTRLVFTIYFMFICQYYCHTFSCVLCIVCRVSRGIV